MTVMTKFCPYCERDRLVSRHIEEVPIVYLGETFLCTAEWFVCFSCDTEFECSDSRYDPQAEARQKYEVKFC